MHQLLNEALDVLTQEMGAPSGLDGKWKWMSPRDQQPSELYLTIEDPDVLYLHIQCQQCPLKFSEVANLQQLRTVLRYLNEVKLK